MKEGGACVLDVKFQFLSLESSGESREARDVSEQNRPEYSLGDWLHRRRSVETVTVDGGGERQVMRRRKRWRETESTFHSRGECAKFLEKIFCKFEHFVNKLCF
jgi:hypothetical protein